jgi:hypothetical protein
MPVDDLTRMLLAQLSGASADSISPADIVERSLGDDPIAEQVVAALRQRESQVVEEPQDDGEVADVLERLYDELELLRRRSGLLADALGACQRCFGEDDYCPTCHGRGRPGGRRPDPSLFADFVLPAVDRARHEGLAGTAVAHAVMPNHEED